MVIILWGEMLMSNVDEDDVVGRVNMHSCHVRTKIGDAVVVKERILHKDGSTSPNLKVFNNPNRNFYITNKKYRTYKYKPELEVISRLDKYTVPNWDMRRRLAAVLDMPPKWYTDAQLFRNPYVFGADISIEALIKMYYLDTYDVNIPPTYGFLDIETSIDTGEIILVSVIANGTVYVGIHQAFLFKEVDGNRVRVEFDEINTFVHTKFDEYISKLKPVKNKVTQAMIDDMKKQKYVLKIFDGELPLLGWIFGNMHKESPDFVGIWNMNFDIPKILDSIKKSRYSAEAIFSDTSLDNKLKYLKYYEDKNPRVAHFTLKWHWLYSSSGSQFIDSMGLYSQCRRTNGFLGSYTLDSILDNELGLGKLPLCEGQSHVVMQRHHFMDYVVYNMFDVIGLNLIEQKNNDILSMSILSGPTPVARFATSTVKTTNNLYHHYIGKGKVLSSASNEDAFVRFDKLFSNAGGTVLDPSRVRDVGVMMKV